MIMRSTFFTILAFFGNLVYGQDQLILRQNITEHIDDSLILCYEEFSEKPLLSIYDELESKFVQTNERKFKYWQAYLKMYLYLYKRDSKEMDDAINILEELKPTSSEEFALMAFLKSFKMSLIKESTQIRKFGEQARALTAKSIELNQNNVRAYFVLANLEYHKPKADKKKIESYIEYALGVQESTQDYYGIIWGRNLIYDLYIKYYIKARKRKKAKKIYKEAKKEFQNDYLINKYYALFKN